jgi:3-methyladenine DNA glycosylase AlkD
MAAYMRHIAPYLGLKRPVRSNLQKAFFAAVRLEQPAPADVLTVMTQLYALPEREFAYLAIDLCLLRHRTFTRPDIDAALRFVDATPWWDTVDALRKPVSLWTLAHRNQAADLTAQLLAGSMWSQRVALTLQLQWKDATDRTLLWQTIDRTRHDQEFFIQKAIGWALRDFARTDPAWVRAAVDDLALTGLARREALKHL